MFLAVDVGNTNIVIGGFSGDELAFVSRMQTCPGKMEDEYAIALNSILRFHGYAPADFDGAMISCVVPPLNQTLKKAIGGLFSCKPLIISPGTKTGLNIKIDSPTVLGGDLVAGAVGAVAYYPMPCVVLDLGTATKFSILDQNGCFIGASILPGVYLSLEALCRGTAMLPHIDFADASNVIGKNSAESMRSGIVFGTASMIDGMLERISEELSYKVNVVATGGVASSIIPYCKAKIEIDDTLVLRGIKLLYEKNTRA